jgi:small subunit ribosomal protein S4
VSIKDKMRQNAMVMEARNVAQSQNTVPWLEINRDELKAKVVAMPKREDVQTPAFNEQLIVELYSK